MRQQLHKRKVSFRVHTAMQMQPIQIFLEKSNWNTMQTAPIVQKSLLGVRRDSQIDISATLVETRSPFAVCTWKCCQFTALLCDFLSSFSCEGISLFTHQRSWKTNRQAIGSNIYILKAKLEKHKTPHQMFIMFALTYCSDFQHSFTRLSSNFVEKKRNRFFVDRCHFLAQAEVSYLLSTLTIFGSLHQSSFLLQEFSIVGKLGFCFPKAFFVLPSMWEYMKVNPKALPSVAQCLSGTDTKNKNIRKNAPIAKTSRVMRFWFGGHLRLDCPSLECSKKDLWIIPDLRSDWESWEPSHKRTKLHFPWWIRAAHASPQKKHSSNGCETWFQDLRGNRFTV